MLNWLLHLILISLLAIQCYHHTIHFLTVIRKGVWIGNARHYPTGVRGEWGHVSNNDPRPSP